MIKEGIMTCCEVVEVSLRGRLRGNLGSADESGCSRNPLISSDRSEKISLGARSPATLIYSSNYTLCRNEYLECVKFTNNSGESYLNGIFSLIPMFYGWLDDDDDETKSSKIYTDSIVARIMNE